MTWAPRSVRIAGEAVRDGLARLADVAPDTITLLSEETDWGLVGGDFLEAMDMESQNDDGDVESGEHHDELVEA